MTYTSAPSKHSQSSAGGRNFRAASVCAVVRMWSLAELFVAGLLVANGAAVLNEERFLVKIGWGYEASRNEPASVKKQIISLLHALRLLFVLPLIPLNILTIVLKLILG